MKAVAVVGGTGYTGGELLRLLVRHPGVRIHQVTSERLAGKPVGEAWPHLAADLDLRLEEFDPRKVGGQAEVAFVALPHGAAMDAVAALHSEGTRVIDLSADYRLRETSEYQRWYGSPHRHPELLRQAVYGLPERYRESIRAAQIVSNPGCYPTAGLLAVLPVVETGWIDRSLGVIVDAKSGVSGAGREPGPATHFPEVNEGVTAYQVGRHRHLPEFRQELAAAGLQAPVVFTPHLVPITRGILATVYFRLSPGVSPAEAADRFRERYAREPFITVLEGGRSPNPKRVWGTNRVEVAFFPDPEGGSGAVAVAAIDNLGKGAAGQAIQNLNLMLGLDERTGLEHPAVFP